MPAEEKLYIGSRNGQFTPAFPYVIMEVGSGRIQEQGVTDANGGTNLTYGDLCRLGDVIMRPDWEGWGEAVGLTG